MYKVNQFSSQSHFHTSQIACLPCSLIAHSSSVVLAATAGRNQVWPLPCNMQSVDTSRNCTDLQFVLLAPAFCWYICSWLVPKPRPHATAMAAGLSSKHPSFLPYLATMSSWMRLNCLSSLAGRNSGVQEDMYKQPSERLTGLGKTLQGGHLIIDDLYKKRAAGTPRDVLASQQLILQQDTAAWSQLRGTVVWPLPQVIDTHLWYRASPRVRGIEGRGQAVAQLSTNIPTTAQHNGTSGGQGLPSSHTTVIWKRSPHGHEYIYPWSSSFQSMSSISTSS